MYIYIYIYIYIHIYVAWTVFFSDVKAQPFESQCYYDCCICSSQVVLWSILDVSQYHSQRFVAKVTFINCVIFARLKWQSHLQACHHIYEVAYNYVNCFCGLWLTFFFIGITCLWNVFFCFIIGFDPQVTFLSNILLNLFFWTEFQMMLSTMKYTSIKTKLKLFTVWIKFLIHDMFFALDIPNSVFFWNRRDM